MFQTTSRINIRDSIQYCIIQVSDIQYWITIHIN